MPNPCDVLTDRQHEAVELVGAGQTHTMLFGGSRSGKTFLTLLVIVARALAAPGSRHAVFRFRFNHVKASVVNDTFPKMMGLCYPGVYEAGKLDKTDFVFRFHNGSEIWFAGLDDKERTEKVLGQEFATIFFNECSQISWDAITTAMSRLAQNVGLNLRAYYDCNPPSKGHWTHRVFIQHLDPERNKGLPNAEEYASLLMNPGDNLENLSPAYIRILEGLPEAKRRRFLLGQFADESENALWSQALLDRQRVLDGEFPSLQRIVIAVDPSGCSGPEDTRSDEIGVVVGGLGTDGKAYILEDLSGHHGPEKWGGIVGAAYDRWDADMVVGESNFGGDMVRAVVQSARPGTPYQAVRASRGKHVRAEPISAIYGQGKVYHVGRFNDIEDQMLGFTTAGYTGLKSPDRADALVWLLTALFPMVTRPSKQKKSVKMPTMHNPMAA